MKNWELCPKCNGQGTCYSPYSSGTSAICDVCQGGKIINSFTGLPAKALVSDFGNITPPAQFAYNKHVGYGQNGEKIYI